MSTSTFIIDGFVGNGSAGTTGDGGMAINAELNGPYGLFCDSSNNLYICDLFNFQIRKVNASTSGTVSNQITTIAGNGKKKYGGDGSVATLASFYYPKGIVVDSSGNAYVADSEGSRVRMIRAVTNIITTLVGDSTYGFNGDNIAASSAKLNFPRGLAIDTSNNNIYIADAVNNRIRMVNQATKIITTVAGSGVAGTGIIVYPPSPHHHPFTTITTHHPHLLYNHPHPHPHPHRHPHHYHYHHRHPHHYPLHNPPFVISI